MQKILLDYALKHSDIRTYEILEHGFPRGDSKVVFDKLADTWFVIYINERGVIKFIYMYDDFDKLIQDITEHIIKMRY